MSQIQYDFFISHSSKDKDSAYHICKSLEEEGFSCWISPRNVGIGYYAKAIVEAIEHSKALILVFSSNSNQSTPVLNEIEIAVIKKLTIIPIKIENILPTKSMEYHLMTSNWFDVFDLDRDLKKVIDVIKKSLDENNSLPIKNSQNKSVGLSGLEKGGGYRNIFSIRNFLTFISFLIVTIPLLYLFLLNEKTTNIVNSKKSITTEFLSQKLLREIQEKEHWKEEYFKLKEKYKDYPNLISKAEKIQQDKGFKEAVSFYINIEESNYQEPKIKNTPSSNLTENIVQKIDINKSEVKYSLISGDTKKELYPENIVQKIDSNESKVNYNLTDNEELKLASEDIIEESDYSILKNLVERYIKISKSMIQRYQLLIESSLRCRRIREQLIRSQKKYGEDNIFTQIYKTSNNGCNAICNNRLKSISKIYISLKELIPKIEALIIVIKKSEDSLSLLNPLLSILNDMKKIPIIENLEDNLKCQETEKRLIYFREESRMYIKLHEECNNTYNSKDK